ncbi:MAG: hypothetical protein ACLFRF_08330, partial [Desulfobacterales bacterium]
DTDNAIDSFADAVEDAKYGAVDPELSEKLSDATKKAVDAIVPADDDGPPLDQGLLTVNDDSGQTEDGAIVIAEGEDTGGNPSVYISDMIGSDMTMTLPEGFWDVTAAGVNSVIDSISAEVQAGLETLATVDTSEEAPADPAMEISTAVSDEDADSITYRVIATISGITGSTNVTLSLQNAQTWDNTTKSLSADGTVTWSVTVLENDGVVTVKRSDTGESRSVTLEGKTIDDETTGYDGTYEGTYVGTERSSPKLDCHEDEPHFLRIVITGNTVSGHIEGTRSGDQITAQYKFDPDWTFSGTISGNVISGTWYRFEYYDKTNNIEYSCTGTFNVTRQ